MRESINNHSFFVSKMKRFVYIFGIILLAGVLAGCSASKKGASNIGKQEMKAAKARYETVVNRNFDYEYLSAKVKYSLKGKSLGGKLNIEHGKRLCMTVTLLGIEVARVEADEDVLLVVDKFDKVFAALPIAEAVSKLGLQEEAKLETLEALLLGRIYIPGDGTASAKDFKRLTWTLQDDQTLVGRCARNKYLLDYTIGADDYLTQTQVSMPDSHARFIWKYASPISIEGGSMPGVETLSGEGEGKQLSAQLTLSAPSVAKKNWNSFTPTSGYREVTFAELLTILKNLKN